MKKCLREIELKLFPMFNESSVSKDKMCVKSEWEFYNNRFQVGLVGNIGRFARWCYRFVVLTESILTESIIFPIKDFRVEFLLYNDCYYLVTNICDIFKGVKSHIKENQEDGCSIVFGFVAKDDFGGENFWVCFWASFLGV